MLKQKGIEVHQLYLAATRAYAKAVEADSELKEMVQEAYAQD